MQFASYLYIISEYGYFHFQAASRHQCLYLVRLHAQEFLLQGGDAQWLRGLDYAPLKLRNLCEVITILAHKPWLIKTEHIEVGVKGCVRVPVSNQHADQTFSMFGQYGHKL